MRDDMPSKDREGADHGDDLRFALLAVLAEGAELEESVLRRILRCSRPDLHGAVDALREAGSIAVRHSVGGGLPGTWVRATSEGRRVFSEQRRALAILAAG